MSSLLIAVILLLWLYNHTFISVTIPGQGSNNEATYTLVEQKSRKTTLVQNSSSSIKKLLPKGDYEILVSRDDGTYFEVTGSKSFLRTTAITAELTAEKKREFIGNNPGPCSYYDQTVLVSYGCDASYRDVSAHLPASVSTPSVTQNDAEFLSDFSFGGIINLAGKRYAFAQGVLDPEAEELESRLFEINPALQPTDSKTLSELDPAKSYKVAAYGPGFVAYSDDFTDIKYFSDPSSKPENIQIDRPKDRSLRAVSLSVEGDKIGIFYSDTRQEDKADPHSETTLKGTTVVQIYEEKKTKSLKFKTGFSTIKLCATKYICLLDGKDLSVFDISDSKQKLVYKILDAKSVESDKDSLFVAREKEVLGFDTNSGKGSVQYSFGAYTYCGMQDAQPTGYTLCINNSKNNLSALYINPTSQNVDNIDKKALTLLGQPFISEVSTYKNFIYIVPELGEPVYDASRNGYFNDPVVTQKTSGQINSAVDTAQIDRSQYSIINVQP